MPTVRAVQGETLDQLLYRVTGRTAGITEEVLRHNPGLAALGAALPEGTAVVIPDRLEQTKQITRTIQLWD
jgi:phage tail protein X